jgi:uncharacterized membrane protein
MKEPHLPASVRGEPTNAAEEVNTINKAFHTPAKNGKVPPNHNDLLPSARQFGEYEKILPGSANRIITMAEHTVGHIQEHEARELKYEFRERLIARLLGAAFAIAALYIAWDLALRGQPWIASIISGTTVIGVVVALVTGHAPRGESGRRASSEIARVLDFGGTTKRG